MLEPTRKRRFFRNRWARPVMGVLAILLVTVLAVLYAPPEGEANNISGDLPATPTVGITNLLETVNVDRTIDFQGVHISLPKAMLATKFSNDRKRAGTYTVRVLVETKNIVQEPVGLDYAGLISLILPDGSKVKTKLVSVKAVQLPETPQKGFFDFPVAEQVPLSALKLQFDEKTIVPFGP